MINVAMSSSSPGALVPQGIWKLGTSASLGIGNAVLVVPLGDIAGGGGRPSYTARVDALTGVLSRLELPWGASPAGDLAAEGGAEDGGEGMFFGGCFGGAFTCPGGPSERALGVAEPTIAGIVLSN